ncbi:MAG: outer membrane beta-barrel protein [Bacteroidota bacterium]
MRLLLLLSVLLLAPASVLVTPAASAQGILGGGLILGLPQGEFGDATDNVGFGFSGIGLYQFPLTPIALGVEGTFMIYGRERFNVPLGSGPLGNVRVDVTTDNNIAQGHFVLRLLPPLPGPITPYADALLGFSYFWTESRVEDEDFQDQDGDGVFDSVNFDDFAFSYGFSAGLGIRLTESMAGSLLLDLRVRYLLGGEAEYLQDDDFNPDGSINFSAVDRSRTDLLIPQIGVIYRF